MLSLMNEVILCYTKNINDSRIKEGGEGGGGGGRGEGGGGNKAVASNRKALKI